jgi:choice-of-anchor A domain-containing protein
MSRLTKGLRYVVSVLTVFALMSMSVMATGPGPVRDTADQRDSADQEPGKNIPSQESGTRNEYIYEDSRIRVKAVCADADAINDKAELKVREIPESSAEYRKHQKALDKKNALLYDISFMLNGREVEPTDGKVKVSVSFKNGQLSDDLGISRSSDLEVIHFADKNAEPETLKASVKGETASFETESFSEFAFASKDGNALDSIDWNRDFVVLNQKVNGKCVYYFDNVMTDAEYNSIGGKGNIALEYHYITDDSETFTGNPAVTGYSADRALGILGSFHIVAFDKASLNVHTNGNVMAKNLEANVNFGTNNFAHESTYVAGKYEKVNSASSGSHILAVSESTKLGFCNNGNSFSVNGANIDRPKIIYRDSASKKFIDMNNVKKDISALSGRLAGMESGGIEKSVSSGGEIHYNISDPDGTAVINMSAADVTALKDAQRDIYFEGFKKGHSGSVIVNVDMSKVDSLTLPARLKMKVDGNEVGANEVSEFSSGKIIWNFVNAEGKAITAGYMLGSIIAPDSSVKMSDNLNGTVIAKTVSNSAETHRDDFTGKIDVPKPEEKLSAVFRKTDGKNVLNGASFTLGKIGDGFSVSNVRNLDEKSGTYESGDLEKDSRYLLTETKAPDGCFADGPWVLVTGQNDMKLYKATVKDGKVTGYDEKQEIRKDASDGFVFDIVNRKTIRLDLIKKAEDSGAKLAGAEFSMREIDGKTLKTDGYIKTASTDSNGKTGFDGLQKGGKYLLTETKAPEGYSISGPWTVSVSDSSVTFQKAVTGKDGSISEEGNAEALPISRDQADLSVLKTVTDSPATESEKTVLPSTGGSGTRMCYLAGAVLTVSAALYICFRKSKKII